MTTGLQIWDANGVQTFYPTTKIFKKFGQVEIGQAGSGDGSIIDSRFSIIANGINTGQYLLLPLAGANTIFGRPTITFENNNSVVWRWPGTDRGMYSLIYGVI